MFVISIQLVLSKRIALDFIDRNKIAVGLNEQPLLI